MKSAKWIIFIIFGLLMVPIATLETKSIDILFTGVLSETNDPVRFDPEDTTYNKFYGPLNAMAIKAGKNLAFSLAHNDQEYLVILFSLFILIPLFIFLILLFKLHDLFYEGRGLTPSLKDTYRYYALISFIMVFFMYFLYRRHIFSNELFYAVISLAIFIFLIKDNFTLKSNFNKALILVLIGASFNIGSLIFSSIIIGIYVFRSLFLLRDSKKILLRSFLVLSLKGTLFLVLLGVFFVYGFDFEGFVAVSRENEVIKRFASPVEYIIFLSYLAYLFIYYFIVKKRPISVLEILFFGSLLSLIFFTLTSIITMLETGIFAKRTTFLLGFLIFIFSYIFSLKRKYYKVHIGLLLLALLTGEIQFVVEKRMVQMLMKKESLSLIKKLRVLESQLKKELVSYGLYKGEETLSYMPFIISTDERFVNRVRGDFVHYPEVSFYAPHSDIVIIKVPQQELTNYKNILAKEDEPLDEHSLKTKPIEKILKAPLYDPKIRRKYDDFYQLEDEPLDEHSLRAKPIEKILKAPLYDPKIRRKYDDFYQLEDEPLDEHSLRAKPIEKILKAPLYDPKIRRKYDDFYQFNPTRKKREKYKRLGYFPSRMTFLTGISFSICGLKNLYYNLAYMGSITKRQTKYLYELDFLPISKKYNKLNYFLFVTRPCPTSDSYLSRSMRKNWEELKKSPMNHY